MTTDKVDRTGVLVSTGGAAGDFNDKSNGVWVDGGEGEKGEDWWTETDRK